MELIAEIGQAHDGSWGQLVSMVDVLCGLPVDTIKLQHHIAAAESSESEQFRVKFSQQDKTRYDYWQRMELPFEILRDVKQLVESRGKRFLCTAFSLQALDDLEKLGVDRYKIGSADVSNGLLLRRIAETGRPVIVSNGLRDFAAMAKALETLRGGQDDIVIMHCTSAYPTPLESVNLGEIDVLRERFGLPVGLSDHSGSIWPSTFALAHGAVASEFHFVWDRRQFGPDSSSSLVASDIELLGEAVRAWHLTHANRLDDSVERSLRTVAATFSRSVRVRRDIKAGDTLCLSHLECFKPGGLGISAGDAAELLGKRSSVRIAAGSIFSEAHRDMFRD